MSNPRPSVGRGRARGRLRQDGSPGISPVGIRQTDLHSAEPHRIVGKISDYHPPTPDITRNDEDENMLIKNQRLKDRKPEVQLYVPRGRRSQNLTSINDESKGSPGNTNNNEHAANINEMKTVNDCTQNDFLSISQKEQTKHEIDKTSHTSRQRRERFGQVYVPPGRRRELNKAQSETQPSKEELDQCDVYTVKTSQTDEKVFVSEGTENGILDMKNSVQESSIEMWDVDDSVEIIKNMHDKNINCQPFKTIAFSEEKNLEECANVLSSKIREKFIESNIMNCLEQNWNEGSSNIKTACEESDHNSLKMPSDDMDSESSCVSHICNSNLVRTTSSHIKCEKSSKTDVLQNFQNLEINEEDQEQNIPANIDTSAIEQVDSCCRLGSMESDIGTVISDRTECDSLHSTLNLISDNNLSKSSLIQDTLGSRTSDMSCITVHDICTNTSAAVIQNIPGSQTSDVSHLSKYDTCTNTYAAVKQDIPASKTSEISHILAHDTCGEDNSSAVLQNIPESLTSENSHLPVHDTGTCTNTSAAIIENTPGSQTSDVSYISKYDTCTNTSAPVKQDIPASHTSEISHIPAHDTPTAFMQDIPGSHTSEIYHIPAHDTFKDTSQLSTSIHSSSHCKIVANCEGISSMEDEVKMKVKKLGSEPKNEEKVKKAKKKTVKSKKKVVKLKKKQESNSESLSVQGDKNQNTDQEKQNSDNTDNEESWDKMFDDDGECLDPNLMQELTSNVGGKVKIKKPIINYLNYQPKEPELDYEGMNHVIEIFDFSPELKTEDLLSAFSHFKSKGFDIKWVDDTHALGVFSSVIAANEALHFTHPLLKVGPLSQASRQSKLKAKRAVEFLQPYKERPETTAVVARRMLTGALGLKPQVSKEQREKEREEKQKLKQAKDKKKKERQQKDDIWEGNYTSNMQSDNT